MGVCGVVGVGGLLIFSVLRKRLSFVKFCGNSLVLMFNTNYYVFFHVQLCNVQFSRLIIHWQNYLFTSTDVHFFECFGTRTKGYFTTHVKHQTFFKAVWMGSSTKMFFFGTQSTFGKDVKKLTKHTIYLSWRMMTFVFQAIFFPWNDVCWFKKKFFCV